LYKVVFTFPPPLILALMLNEVRNLPFKRSVQTLVYMPHFLSWVVVSGIFINILSPQGGVVNIFLERVVGMEPIFFMGKEAWFRPIVVVSSIWKESGFESIIYLASIAAISHELYEAASIDGASRWQQLWRITLPSLLPTIIILFLLRIGRFLEIGFDQIYTLANPLVWPVADIFDTYVYRKGLLEGAYSITTAVNLFKTVVGIVLLTSANWAARRIAGRSLF
jgi:putative aldouronate transport system permease protein